MEQALSFTPVQFIPQEQIIAGSLILNLEKIEQTWDTNKVNHEQAKELNTLLQNKFSTFYDKKLENLPLNEQIYKIVKTIDSAYVQRK